MIAFFKRLRLALRVLRAKKFVVFLPDYKKPLVMEMGVRGQINVLAWRKMRDAVAEGHGEAIDKVNGRLLADVDAGGVQESRLINGQPVPKTIRIFLDGEGLLKRTHSTNDEAI